MDFRKRKRDGQAFPVRQKGNPRSSTSPQVMGRARKPRLPKKVTDFISREISRQSKEGKPQAQSIAIAFSKARKKFPAQRRKLELIKVKGNPHITKRTRSLIFLLLGTALALQVLRETRR